MGGPTLRPHATVKSMASPAQSHVPLSGTLDMSDINIPLHEDRAERVGVQRPEPHASRFMAAMMMSKKRELHCVHSSVHAPGESLPYSLIR